MGLQEIINALCLAGIYACVGMGFSLLYGIMNIINLAHGAMVMLGAYITFWMFELWGVDPLLSIPIVMAMVFCVGYLMQKYFINNVIKSDILNALMITYGFQLLILGFALFIWKSDYRAITTSYYAASLKFAGVIVPYTKLIILAIAVALTLALRAFMNKTRVGMSLKATSLNKESAQLVGINIRRAYAISCGIGCAIAGAAGSLVAVSYTITPTTEGTYLGSAFVIAVLGGLGNVTGAIVGGIVLAFVETIGALYLGMSFQKFIGFAILLLVLVFRPYGLVGRQFYAERK